MNVESSIAVKDPKERTNRLSEVFDVERKLWTYVNSRGLLNADVQNLYRKARSLYESFLLGNNEIDELQEIEYSLWKLHYKHIDEFRKRMSQSSGKEETEPSKNHENVLKGFKLFLGESSTFYQDLIGKIKRLYGFQDAGLFYDSNDVSSQVNQVTLHKCQFLCHHLLVRIGDLARYLEVHEKPGIQKNNWYAAAKYYLEAAKMYPNGGNPHNQLAWLGTYIGDEFLALYHCVRSLAAKEPFPDASNNLTVIFETNQSTHINSLSSEAEFNFLKPYERVIISAKLQMGNGASGCNALNTAESACSIETDFWSLVVRMAGFFFLEYRLDIFAYTFGSTIRAMEALLTHDDAELSSALESYQNVNLSRPGPYRALHLVSVLIITIQYSLEKPEVDSLKLHMAFATTFIIMGRVFERCVKGVSIDKNPLLPAVLVFSEWLVGVLDKVVKCEMEEKPNSSASYFFSSYVELLNRLVDCQVQVRLSDNVTLWEDYEMRGYKPISQFHSSLDFSDYPENDANFGEKNEHRVLRILQAAIKIASDDSQGWMLYEKGGRFCMKEGKSGSLQRKFLEMEENPSSDSESKSSKAPAAMVEENGISMKGKLAVVEEEEDIVFKPITRYNSAPLPAYLTQKVGISQESVKKDPNPQASDESIRRASSLLIAQNRALIDALTSSAALTVTTHPKSSMTSSITEAHMSSAGPRPPSLSAWFLNDERIDKVGGSLLKPIDEIASDGMSCLSLVNEDERFGFVSSAGEASTSTECSSSPHYNYRAPTPSAPLLPEDATWLSEIPGPKASSFIHYSPPMLGPPTPAPEWLILRKENQNPHWSNNHNSGMQQHQCFAAPWYAGNIYVQEAASRVDILGGLGYPMAPFQPVYMDSIPTLHPSPPHINGFYDQRGETMLFRHNSDHERAVPYVCGSVMDVRTNQQQQLLQHLNEKELRIQQDAQVTRSTYPGN